MEDVFFAYFYSRELNVFVWALMHDNDSSRVIKKIKNKDVDPDSRYCVDGVDLPVLYIAATHGKYDAADTLIDMGASVNDYVESCGTKYPLILYLLVSNESDEALAYFYGKKANIQSPASDGTDALYWACVNKKAKLVEKFLSEGFNASRYYHGK